MRRWTYPWLLLLAAGCSQPAPTPEATPAKPGTAPSATTPEATAVFKESELAPFFTKLSGIAGHGAWSPETIAASIKQMKGIKKGGFLAGDLHMDHKGSHVDVTMRVDREAEDQYRLRFTAPNDELVQSIAKILPKPTATP